MLQSLANNFLILKKINNDPYIVIFIGSSTKNNVFNDFDIVLVSDLFENINIFYRNFYVKSRINFSYSRNVDLLCLTYKEYDSFLLRSNLFKEEVKKGVIFNCL